MYLLLIGGWLLYNVVLVSAIHQNQSAIGIHMSHCSSRWHVKELDTERLTLWHFHGNVYVLMLLPQFAASSPSFPTSTSLFSMSVSSTVALQIGSLVPFFWIPYIHFNIWYLFSSFQLNFTLYNREPANQHVQKSFQTIIENFSGSI